jgi:DnaJ homolog subfamily C member 2
MEDDLGVGDEEETAELLALDPKEWKVCKPKQTLYLSIQSAHSHGDPSRIQKQDHYAVLGLSHLRYKATDDQIKIARGFSADSHDHTLLRILID